jgi:hypothetical protein
MIGRLFLHAEVSAPHPSDVWVGPKPLHKGWVGICLVGRNNIVAVSLPSALFFQRQQFSMMLFKNQTKGIMS